MSGHAGFNGINCFCGNTPKTLVLCDKLAPTGSGSWDGLLIDGLNCSLLAGEFGAVEVDLSMKFFHI
jgi:hypothetical protein